MKIVNNLSQFLNTNKSIYGTTKFNITKKVINANLKSESDKVKQVVNSNRESAKFSKRFLASFGVDLKNEIENNNILTTNVGPLNGMRPFSRIGSIYNSKGETENSKSINSEISFGFLFEENA